MKKILRKGAILLVIFVAVVTGTSFLMNSQSTDNRSDMNDATLPEVMVKIGSTQANKMYGSYGRRLLGLKFKASTYV